MKRLHMVLLCIFGLPMAVRAYDWPVEGPRLVSGFGEASAGRFDPSVSVVSSADAVRPIAAGEVVFRYDPARRQSSFPRGIGAHVVVQHPEQVRSVYAHLSPGSPGTSDTVWRSTVIGRVGDSGSALGSILGLYVFDMETSSYLNPLMVLPGLQDRQPPVIARVLLERDGSRMELARASSVQPGQGEILVEAYDLREDVGFRWRLAPHVVSLSVNGRQTASITFDTLRMTEAGLVEGSSGRAASGVYTSPWVLRLGEIQFRLGDMRLQVFVRDFAGNESTRETVLSIRG